MDYSSTHGAPRPQFHRASTSCTSYVSARESLSPEGNTPTRSPALRRPALSRTDTESSYVSARGSLDDAASDVLSQATKTTPALQSPIVLSPVSTPRSASPKTPLCSPSLSRASTPRSPSVRAASPSPHPEPVGEAANVATPAPMATSLASKAIYGSKLVFKVSARFVLEVVGFVVLFVALMPQMLWGAARALAAAVGGLNSGTPLIDRAQAAYSQGFYQAQYLEWPLDALDDAIHTVWHL